MGKVIHEAQGQKTRIIGASVDATITCADAKGTTNKTSRKVKIGNFARFVLKMCGS